MQDQGGNIDLLEVLGEVSLRECFDTVISTLDRYLHALKPERISHALRSLGIRSVIAIEGQAEVFEKLGPVGHNTGTNSIEDRDRQASRVVVGFQHQGRHGSDQHSLRDPLATVSTNIAGNFAASRGMTYQDRAFEIEVLEEFSQVVSICVHVVAVPRLA